MTEERTKIPYLPGRIEGLASIAMNLSWSWNRKARALFALVDETLWHLTKHNPIALLRRVDPGRLSVCARDAHFLSLYDEVLAEFAQLGDNESTWFAGKHPELAQNPIAYFCAEFGLHNSVPIYSGGLGVLAGDHCKACSDIGVPLIGVGLFYKNGYFDQRLRPDGWQEDSDDHFDPQTTPLEPVLALNRDPFVVTVRTFGRDITVGAWRMMVGRVPIYLLDTDLEGNHPDDRVLTSKLYAGGPGMRLRQEWILGVGGVRLLRALGINPSAWHANEGHAAFMMVERVRELTAQEVPFAEAVSRVRTEGIFTTHTPVPAGHDTFSFDQVAECAGPIWEEMGVDRDTLLGLGRHPIENHGEFHMTVAALRLSSRVNGVARPHGAVSRDIWHPLWPDRTAKQVPIGHVTNGVHLPTWMATQMMDLLDRHLGPDWPQRAAEPRYWDRVLEIDDAELWKAHAALKSALHGYIREQARRRWAREWKEAAHVVGAGTLLDPNALTIGFARRFATYKRANLIFRDLDRLHKLLVNERHPVQIVFAGKAHPADTPGKEVLQAVYHFTRDSSLEGRVAFIEDYDMHLAHRLVQGVDLWMNLPRVPLEASGTSGMKAALNGVPQLSTLDGWWHEAYDGLNGWAIPPAPVGADADAADAEHLYTLLENRVVPLFYARDERGTPAGWVEKMKHALRVAGQHFTAERMVRDYADKYYVPAMRGESGADNPPTA